MTKENNKVSKKPWRPDRYLYELSKLVSGGSDVDGDCDADVDADAVGVHKYIVCGCYGAYDADECG